MTTPQIPARGTYDWYDFMTQLVGSNNGKVDQAVSEGRYRRVLSELTALAPGADPNPTINAAMAASAGYTVGTELVIPHGLFDGTVELVAQNAGSVISGQGPGKTALRNLNNSDVIEFRGTQAAPMTNARIENLELIGGGATVANANQRGIYLQWCPGVVIRNVKISGAGNNGLNVFQCDGGLVQNVEVTACRDFGGLIFKSAHVRVVDYFAHDIGVAGRANQGLQFKNCRDVWATRPVIQRIQGYGLMTRMDPAELGPLDEATAVDEDNAFIDAYVSEITAGGFFSATSLYLENTSRPLVQGGVFKSSALGHISVANTSHLRLQVRSVRDCVSAAISLSGQATVGYRIFDTHVEAGQQGFVFSDVGWGSLRDSSAINGTGTSLNAACRVRNGTRGLSVTDCDFSDRRPAPTQARGIYEEASTGTGGVITGANRFEHNTAIGNTVADIAVLTSQANPNTSKSFANGTTASPIA